MTLSIILVFLSALLAATNVPFSKYLLANNIPALLLSSLTFLGGSIGTGIIAVIRLIKQKKNFKAIKGRDWFYMFGINAVDTAANVMLFYGISMLSGDTASLLQSFEIVSSALVAYLLFKERPSLRLILGIAIVLSGSVILSFNPASGFSFEPASLLIIGATICWGFDNNFTKKISDKDPFEFSFFKCVVPGLIILIIALCTGKVSTDIPMVSLSLLDGFVAYGLSVTLLTLGFRKLSATLGSAIYAINPFFGAILSLIFYPYLPSWNFYVAVTLLVAGEIIVAIDAHVSGKKKDGEMTNVIEPPRT